MIYYIFIQAVEPSRRRFLRAPWPARCLLLAFAVLGLRWPWKARSRRASSAKPTSIAIYLVDNDASRMGQAWPFEATAPRVITMLSLNRRKRTLFVEARGRTCTLTDLRRTRKSPPEPPCIILFFPLADPTSCIVFSSRQGGSQGESRVR